MAPRGQALPQAATESAREARKSFFCELCQKGYARMNDFEAHEGSYDHQHRKRLKEMKQLTKDPNAANKAREAERKANEEAGLKSINVSLPGAAAGSSTKKKPVFKSTLQPHNAAVVGQATGASSTAKDLSMNDVANDDWLNEYNADPTQMNANGWADDQYDPRFPASDCPQCRGPCDGHGLFDPRESYEAYMKRTEPELKALESRLRASIPVR
ncbi:hypothetical protein B0A55_06700 [Friedmanniomyces simplex]|uniref:C2H2-type domain-containing protein n=1 Tax=Friedmanniomyces simplex TaxID=329884 RepID=A0A4U0X4I6_9PEZI|nr:hypothetical protein B0A55_06700 [Friedmanniomyces simplex]